MTKSDEKSRDETKIERVSKKGKKAYDLWNRLVNTLSHEAYREERVQNIVQQIQSYFKSIGHEEGVKLTEKVLAKGESADVKDYDKVRALIHSYWFSEEAKIHGEHSADVLPSVPIPLNSAEQLVQTRVVGWDSLGGKLSEAKIKELHSKLAEKRIAQIKAYAEKKSGSVLVKLKREIIDLRREIQKELKNIEKRIKGNKRA